jgi:SAM-dependent methyltransferase
MIRNLIEKRLSALNRWRWAYWTEVWNSAWTVIPESRLCNICGYSGYFHPFGRPLRAEASCPGCFSLERHRNLKLWFDGNAGRFRQANVLHFAPEPAVKRFIQPASAKYITADIELGVCDLALDIENINLDDEQFDIVICSHVLEHVEDRKALRELNRVLRPGGLLLLMVPVIEGWLTTYEDNSVMTDKDRTRFFGQRDHKRLYGADIRHRIEEAKFEISEFTAVEPFVSRYGLFRGEKVFVAERRKVE